MPFKRKRSAKPARRKIIIVIALLTVAISIGVVIPIACSSLNTTPTPETEPTVAPAPSPTPTSAPTSTPTPGPTFTPTPTPTRTPTPEPTDTPTPLPTSTPTPTPIPTSPPAPTSTPTPQPTNTPTPTPQPAQYQFENIAWTIRGPEADRVAVTFTVHIRNVGEIPPDQPVPLMVAIEDQQPSTAIMVQPTQPGIPRVLVFDVLLQAGSHNLQLLIHEAVSDVSVDILATDLVITPKSYQIVANQQVEVKADVTNIGTVPTGPVSVLADTTSVGTVRPLQSGEGQEITFRLPLPAGQHQVTLFVNPDAREVAFDNNSATLSLDIDYVSLIIQTESVVTTGYTRDGLAIVEIATSITNRGLAPSGPFDIGIQCDQQTQETCSGTLQVESLTPGQAFQGTLTVNIPQGDTTAAIYAGQLDDGYRWGQENVLRTTLSTPPQPEIDFRLTADTELLGYYADGTASVSLSATLTNLGSRPFPGPRDVFITCQSGQQKTQTCSTKMTLDLGDEGYGPARATVDLKVPMGELEIVIIRDEDISQTVQVSVPHRIVNVTQDTWQCLTDTNYNTNRGDEPRGSCGGLASNRILKWNHQQPIKWWADGDRAYIDVFEDAITELQPVLNLQFERVFDDNEAHLTAYVGIPPDQADSFNIRQCEGAWQSCTTSRAGIDQFINLAEIAVFQNTDPKYQQLRITPDAVEFTMKQVLIQTLTPMQYRNTPDSIMDIDTGLRIPALSPSDTALLDIYMNPLVSSGITVSELQDIIVFDEDLIDQPEPTSPNTYETVSQAFVKLQQAGSAQFEMQGRWSGGTCQTSFGPSQITVHSFTPYRALNYRLTDIDQRFLVFLGEPEGTAEYWKASDRSWRPIEIDDDQTLTRETAWNPQFSDPLIMLASILWFADDRTITEVSRNEEQVRYSVNLNDAFVTPTWADGVDALDVTISINLQNQEITAYTMDWRFDTRGLLCSDYYVEATLAEYDTGIIIPSDVRDRSRFID